MQQRVRLTGCKVKSVRADLVENEVTITFTTFLDAQVMDEKRLLALWRIEKAPVDVMVEEQAPQLVFWPAKPETEPETAEE